MARRSGQSGYVEKKGNAYYVRFWIDVPGQEKRAHKSVRICPVSGPGKITKPERERKARKIIAASGADTEEHFNKVEAINLGTTFRQQAEWWLNHVQPRKRRPVKPRTVASWKVTLEKWLNPNLGDSPLASVNNFAVKGLVSKMATAGLAAKSIHSYIQVVKMILASAVNDQGEEIYPRKWNHEFIDMPEIKNQRTPTFSSEEVTAIVAVAEGRYQVLYTLLAGTGLRIAEALALEIDKHLDGTTIKVRQSLWKGRVYSPKTPNAQRDIDLDPALGAILRQFIGRRTAGFLFQARSGNPVDPSEALRHLHSALENLGREKCGLHAFRRYRTTWLRKNRVPEDLVRYWIGHAGKSVTDGYSKVKDDLEFRREVCVKAGLGFEPPEIQAESPKLYLNVPKKSDSVVIECAA